MSGAQVLVGKRLVYKWATAPDVAAKTAAEGLFLQKLTPGTVPRIYAVGKSWYLMERLQELPTWADKPALMHELINMLELRFWRQEPTRLKDDWKLFWELLDERLSKHTPYALTPLRHWMGSLDLKALRRGLLHNDATLDNLMLRGVVPVLTDPLAPRPNLPEVLALDVGKLLQSAYGYELIKGGMEPRLVVPPHKIFEWAGLDANERSAACFFCAARIGTIIPYFDDPWKRVRLKSIMNRLLDQHSTSEA